jgi:hypothetical protein
MLLINIYCYHLKSWCSIMQEVLPLDLTEIMVNLVRQSEPILDQLGVRKGIDKIK